MPKGSKRKPSQMDVSDELHDEVDDCTHSNLFLSIPFWQREFTRYRLNGNASWFSDSNFESTLVFSIVSTLNSLPFITFLTLNLFPIPMVMTNPLVLELWKWVIFRYREQTQQCTLWQVFFQEKCVPSCIPLCFSLTY